MNKIDFKILKYILERSHRRNLKQNATNGNRMFKNFLIFFVSFNNSHALRNVEKPKHLKLVNISTNKIIPPNTLCFLISINYLFHQRSDFHIIENLSKAAHVFPI